MIYSGSRYENSTVAVLAGPDGSVRQTILPSSASTSTFQFIYYTVVADDRIDIIAEKFLGDPELWWVIADANPQWMYYESLPQGLTLRIPSGLGTG